MKKYVQWLAVVVILTIVFASMYALVQQDLRQSANDPQVQLAYDAASNLASGSTLEQVVPDKRDVSSSLAPFLVIYDKSGKAVAGSGTIDGKLPVMPLGALKMADSQGYNAVTWEPKDGVRLAAVAVSGKDYYVVSARSLFLVEKREDQTMLIATAGWGVSILIFLTVLAVPARKPKTS